MPRFIKIPSLATMILCALALSAQAQVKISGLPAAGTLTGSELVPIVQGGSTLAASLSQIAQYATSQAGVISTNPSISSGVLTLNYNNGSYFEVTVNQNITSVVLTNLPTSPNMWTFVVRFIIASPGGYTINWPSGWTYPGGTKPALTTTAAVRDVYFIAGGWPSSEIDLYNAGQDRF